MTRVFFNQNIISPYRLPLFEELNEDYDVSVWFHRASSEKREWKTELEDYNFDYRVLNGRRVGPITLNLGFFFRLLKENHDVYFINENPSTFLQSFAILVAAKLRNKPVVVWSETIETEKSKELSNSLLKKIPVKIWRGFKETYRKILFKFSDRFVAFSQMAEEFLTKREVPEKKIDTQIQVMPEQLLPEPENHNLDEKYSGKKLILSLGYLEQRKGVQDLIEAFRKIDGEDYRLVIAGTGPYKEELKKKAEGEDRIEFVGYLSEQEKANYYDAADLFVLPTYHDPWGLVVNEAIHYGTSVVTTEAAGSKEVLEEENIVDTGDSTELSNKLKEGQEGQVKSIEMKEGLKAIRKSISKVKK